MAQLAARASERHTAGVPNRPVPPRGPAHGAPDLPDSRDGLTRLERLILFELDRARRELGRQDVPTTLLYGRVVERMGVSVAAFQAALGRLGGRR